jgi:hypothetical protein
MFPLQSGGIMAARSRKKVELTAPKSRTLTVEMKLGESEEYTLAKAAASPYIGATFTVASYGHANMGEISVTDLVRVLKEQAESISDGDLSNVEAMLGSQAIALNVVFAEMARRAALNMGEYLGAAETYLKLALRAQSQCRATLETLVTIKNPPVVFAKQANIAHGLQQVNNHAATPLARAERTKKGQNELLEHEHGEWLDRGTTATANGSDSTLEAVGAVYGATQP